MPLRPGSVPARAFVLLQHLLPQHTLSHLVRRLTRVRVRFVKDMLIRAFVRRFRPVMHEALEPDPRKYGSFNEFFTRALAPGVRAIAQGAVVASPVDGTISQAGPLDGDRLPQAKGRHYSLAALLAGAAQAGMFRGGSFATLYLAPSNYHRIHMPLTGTLRSAWYVPGRLFSVNAATAEAVDSLFARNERVICAFDGPEGPFALVLVGALFVGSMTTLWHGEIAPGPVNRALRLPAPPGTPRLSRGEELGRFNMGSTVILLFPHGAVQWLPQVIPGAPIRVGQPLARLGP
jgi:phosphatidylserine decarboxylase